jgi:hypothetical protein
MFNSSPVVSEVGLSRNYRFMYENFVVATQRQTFLLMERDGDQVRAIKFDSANIKYGAPNDEARGGHPLAKYGLGLYGLFEVKNSPWIIEAMTANRVHPSHSDSLFAGQRHFVACFKDVMLEVRCRNMEEVTMTSTQMFDLLASQIRDLDEQK